LTRGGARHGTSILFGLESLGVRVISVTNDIPDNEYAPLIQCIEFIKGQGTSVSISLCTLRGRTASLFDGRMPYCSRPPFAVDRLILSSTFDKLFRIRNNPDGTQSRLEWESDRVIETFPRNPRKGDPNRHALRHFIKAVDQRIVLVPGSSESVEAVKMIFHMHYVQDIGAPTIAMKMNSTGLLSPAGQLWSPGTIHAILNNPIYIGKGIANQRATGMAHIQATGESIQPIRVNNPQKKERYRQVSDWIIGSHPELDFIPLELREQIWALQLERLTKLAERDKTPRRREAKAQTANILIGSIFDKHTQGRMKCQRCGQKPGYRRYFLVKPPTIEDRGKRNSIDGVNLERAVLESLVEVLGDAKQYLPELRKYAAGQLKGSQQDGVNLKELIAEREAKREEKFFTQQQYGDVGKDRLLALIAPLTRQIHLLDQRILAAERAAGVGENDIEEILSSVVDDMKEIVAQINNPSSAALRSIIKLFSRTVVDVVAQEAEIEIRLPDDVVRRKNVLQQMCGASAFTLQPGCAAHIENRLIMAVFGVKFTRTGKESLQMTRFRLTNGHSITPRAKAA
jgi:hypothetical protein